MRFAPVCDNFDDQPLFEVDGHKFILNSLTEQVPATSPQLLQLAAEWISGEITNECDKLLTEEDKGGILLAAIALQTGIPFGMVRWVPNQLATQVSEIFSCEYVKEGTLYLSGIEKNDRVIIIDDIISTGGTMVGIIKTLKKIEAEIIDVLVLAEKIEYNGIKKVKNETDIDVRSLIKISVAGTRSKVLNAIY
ncbi:adenine phosphoribosyltransferase [Candidatus Heimdallarchaeota archaeon B3_Heim]|nr:MAG: adenine phosphoribosyltransferase [Candidatus Heimdallarchaeota archaeon B3_Heim]